MPNMCFITVGCLFCKALVEAILYLNQKLPIDEQIEIIDVTSYDPKLKFLEALYGSPYPWHWNVPVVVLESPTVMRMFGNFYKSRGNRIIITDPVDAEHFHDFVLEFLHRDIY